MKLCLAVLFFACSLFAQSDSISINGSQLKIGMPKSEVLASLVERSELVKTTGIDDGWCVKPKRDHAAGGCGDFIQFSGDKLSAVSRSLGSANGNDTAAMIASFFTTLDDFAKEGKTVLAFTTQEFESDDHVRFRILSFIAGSKKYVFIARQPIGSQGAAISSVELNESFAK